LVVNSLKQLFDLLYYIMFYGIFISVVLSWVAPRGYNPAIKLLYDLTDPLLGFFRRYKLVMGGLDLSPFVALFALQFAKMAIEPLFYQLNAVLN
ncbi:MAG: YggT family protein, partial [Candidatus Methylumidiphilus sp.]